VAQICEHFGITRQAHYQKRMRELEREKDNQIVLEMVRQVRRKHPRMGTRKLLMKIQPMLHAEGLSIGRDRLFELLRGRDLLVQRKKSYRRTTIPGLYRAPNLLPGLIISQPNQVWVCDITYLNLQQGRFAYLFVLMDLFSRYIVGWHVSSSLATEGAVTSLEMALSCLPKITSPLIHHSDHGVQYTSRVYTEALLQNDILPSMGAVGNCYDNIFAERLIGILKGEYLLDQPFASIHQVPTAVEEAVYLYNSDRPHLSLNMAYPSDVYRGKSMDVPVLAIPIGEEVES